MSIDSAAPVYRRYDLTALIARGGAADVYQATDTTLDRQVAVKVLREGAASEADRQRFIAEGRILAQLNHPGLVTLLDVGAEGDRPFLVMELVEGVSLAEQLKDGPLELERVSVLGEQMATALAYAHGAGVVHRDVKPGNILLGGDGRFRLSDFGIARLIGDASRQTGAGLTVGTAAYLAPEQANGADVGPAADVYSLGLVLIEAITGQRVYTGPPIEAAVARLSRPPDVPALLSRAWQGLLREMTAMTPADRPAAGEVADRLRALRVSPLVEPVPPPPVARRLSLPRLRVALAAAVVVILAGSALLLRQDSTPRANGSAPPQVASALQIPLEDLHQAVERLPASHPAADVVENVDRTLENLRYPAAARQLNRMIRLVNADLASGAVDDADGSRVVTAAQILLGLLPLPATPREVSVPPPSAPTTGSSRETKAPPEQQASSKKKSPGNAKGKGRGKGKRG